MARTVKKLIIFIILFWSSVAWGATYYVTDAGTSPYNGSIDYPWSWSNLDGLTGAAPGDTICLSGEFYVDQSAEEWTIAEGGTDEINRIIYDGSGAGVCASATAATLTGTSTASGFYWVNLGGYDWLTFRNITFRGVGRKLLYAAVSDNVNFHDNDVSVTLSDGPGLFLVGCTDWNIYNNLLVHDTPADAIGGDGINLQGGNRISIYNNVFTDWGHASIGVWDTPTVKSTNIFIYNNYASLIDKGFGRFVGVGQEDQKSVASNGIFVYHNFIENTRASNQFQTVWNGMFFGNIIRNLRTCCGTGYMTGCTGNPDINQCTQIAQATWGSARAFVVQNQDTTTIDSRAIIVSNNTFSNIAESAIDLNDNQSRDVVDVIIRNNAMDDTGNCNDSTTDPFCSSQPEVDRSMDARNQAGGSYIRISVDNNLLNDTSTSNEIEWSYSDAVTYWTVTDFNAGSPGTPEGTISRTNNVESAAGFKSATQLWPDNAADPVVGTGLELSPNFTPDSACKAYYAMSGSTTETDICSNDATNNELSVGGGTIETSSDTPYLTAGSSRVFAGTSEYLYVANEDDININGASQAITFMAWMKASSTPADMTVISKWNDPAESDVQQYILRGYRKSDGKALCALRNNANSATVVALSTSTNLGNGDWHHVACVSDNINLTIYVDGRYENHTEHTGGINSTTQQLEIGRRGNGAEYYIGQIDQVYIASRAMNPLEIFQQFAFHQNGLAEKSGYEWADDYLLPTTNWGAGSAIPVVYTIDEDSYGKSNIGAYAEEDADVTAPTVDTRIIQVDGVHLFLTFSETVVVNNPTGFSLSGADGGVSVQSCDTNIAPMDCTLNGTIYNGDSGITLNYSGAPANAIEDAAGNDLADFSGQAVTNNSTAVAPVPGTLETNDRRYYYYR